MDMRDWAKKEIEIACKDEGSYGRACYKSAYKAFQSLLEDGHSGASIVYTKRILDRLIDGRPLTPIEDTPDIWSDIVDQQKEYTSYQCKRMSSLFKHVYKDGSVRYYDTDRFCCFDKDDPDGFVWRSGFVNNLLNAQFPISMPYYPASKPWHVYCTEGLFDPKNGDFDTIAIWYVIKPDGELIKIERFFKESENGFVEIDRQEYEQRAKHDSEATL